MVRLLIQMRGAMLRHTPSTRFARASGLLVLLFSLGLAAATLASGFASYPTRRGAVAVISWAMALWFFGRLGYAAFAGGDAMLRWELFRMLPVTRARLARSLLVLGVLDPAGVILAIAFAALIPIGNRSGPGGTLVACAGLLLTVALADVAVMIVGVLQPRNARRTRDTATMLIAVSISLVAVAGTALPGLTGRLADGRAPALTLIGELLPTGWAGLAVDGALARRWWTAVLPLLGLLALIAALSLWWPRLLARRLDGRAGGSGRRRVRGRAGRMLPKTPVGAVVGKEFRLWLREPIRATFLMLAAVIGLGVCVVPALTAGSRSLMPFGGVLTALIAVAGGANLVGGEGRSLHLVALVPGAAGAESRGRQVAWLIIVAPYVLVLGAVLTGLSGQHWAWPWMLAITLAVLGAGAGLVPLSSVTGVQPTDGADGLTPAWVLKAYAAMLLAAASSAAAIALLVASRIDGTPWLAWLAVGVAGLVGAALGLGLGRLAERRSETRLLDILAVLEGAAHRLD